MSTNPISALRRRLSGRRKPSTTKNQRRAAFLEQMIPKGGIGAEIGVFKGEFIRDLLDVTQPKTLHLMDPWYLLGEEWEWASGERSTAVALAHIIEQYAHELSSRKIVLHIAFDLELLPTFDDHHFDWVYLDSSHQYEHTVEELHILKSKVKPEGVIAGDDWRSDPTHRHHGVCKAIREFVEAEPYSIVYADDADRQWALRRS